MMNKIKDAILDEFYLGHGTVHIDDLLDMFKTNFPSLGYQELQSAIENLEIEGVVSLEGSSGYYHLNQSRVKESKNRKVKITRAKLRRIIKESLPSSKMMSPNEEEEVLKALSGYFEALQNRFPAFKISTDMPDTATRSGGTRVGWHLVAQEVGTGHRRTYRPRELEFDWNPYESMVNIWWDYPQKDAGRAVSKREESQQDLHYSDFHDRSEDPVADFIHHVKEFMDNIISAGFADLNEGTALTRVTRGQIRNLIQEMKNRGTRRDRLGSKIMTRVMQEFRDRYPQFGLRRGHDGYTPRNEFDRMSFDAHLKIPGTRTDLGWEILVTAQSSSRGNPDALINITMDFDYGKYQNISDNHTFTLDDFIESDGKILLDKLDQYANSILSAP